MRTVEGADAERRTDEREEGRHEGAAESAEARQDKTRQDRRHSLMKLGWPQNCATILSRLHSLDLATSEQ